MGSTVFYLAMSLELCLSAFEGSLVVIYVLVKFA